MGIVYHLKNVVKSRVTDSVGFRLLVPSIEIQEGECVALVGASGCGKSTLLDMLAMVLSPDFSWSFELTAKDGQHIDIAASWKGRNQNRMSDVRKRHIGYVLQTGGLLPYLSVRENIQLSRRLLEMEDDGTVDTLLHALGIRRHLDKLPGNLSVGERQRVAFARALAHRPSIIIADEPTATLDPITARKLTAAVMELVKEMNITMITASHDWAHVYNLNFRSLHQESREKEDGRLVESLFRD
jgi:putative ABC transport system ATP-binding protein